MDLLATSSNQHSLIWLIPIMVIFFKYRRDMFWIAVGLTVAFSQVITPMWLCAGVAAISALTGAARGILPGPGNFSSNRGTSTRDPAVRKSKELS